MNTAKIEAEAEFRPVGPLDIYQASTHQPALMEFIQFRADPVLDLNAVSGCDTAGAQLLWAATTTANANGKHLQFKNVPAAVRDSFNRLGLPDIFSSTPD
jgi:anti-anti-sigma regulatory factor